MPAKKQPRRTRRRRRKGSAPRKSLTLSGFPNTKFVKLRYVDSRVTLDASTGSFVQQVYRANSIFDPDFTGLGHQPMGFDQWAAIYHRYTVLGAKITATYSPSAGSNGNPSHVGITLSGDSDPLANYSDIDNILESKLSSNSALMGMISGSRRLSTMKKFSAKHFFGVTDVNDGAAHSALVTTNPSKDAYFSVWSAAVDANDPGSVSIKVVIDYIVQFREPKNLDGS